MISAFSEKIIICNAFVQYDVQNGSYFNTTPPDDMHYGRLRRAIIRKIHQKENVSSRKICLHIRERTISSCLKFLVKKDFSFTVFFTRIFRSIKVKESHSNDVFIFHNQLTFHQCYGQPNDVSIFNYKLTLSPMLNLYPISLTTC